jgi:hypothetical protein
VTRKDRLLQFFRLAALQNTTEFKVSFPKPEVLEKPP